MLQVLLKVSRNRGFGVIKSLYDKGGLVPLAQIMPGTPQHQVRFALAQLVLAGLVAAEAGYNRAFQLTPLGREWWESIRRWDTDVEGRGLPGVPAVPVEAADGEEE